MAVELCKTFLGSYRAMDDGREWLEAAEKLYKASVRCKHYPPGFHRRKLDNIRNSQGCKLAKQQVSQF